MPPKARSARATAVDAARLHRLARQQESLRAVIESISSEVELRPLLGRILRHACDLIDADAGTIGLVDHERNVVRTEVAYHMPADEVGSEMGPGVGVAGAVLATGRPVVLRRYGDVGRVTQPELVEHAVLGVPIVWRGQMVGFFGVGIVPEPGEPRRHFTAADVDALTFYARHAAIAIDNARRLAWERHRTERLALIARVGRIVTANLRLDDLLQSAADAVHELLGYENVAIPLVDPDDPETLVLTTFGGEYKRTLGGRYELPVAAGLIGAAVRAGETVLVNDVAADARYVAAPGTAGIRAELVVPIMIHGRVLGVLNMESRTPFDADDAEGLRVVADQLAVAIENARLYEASQRVAALEERAHLARELHDSVTQLLFSSALIAQSLPDAWRRDAAEGERRTARLVELTRAALAEMRSLLTELRPPAAGGVPAPVPDDRSGFAGPGRGGLVAAVRAHAAAVRRDAPGLALRVRAARYAPQPPAVEHALFRVAQEALNNVVKHARAGRAHVCLASGRRGVTLTVCDDGVGIGATGAAGAPAGPGGMGLGSMRERAAAIGAVLHLAGAPGGGTVVRVHLPARRA